MNILIVGFGNMGCRHTQSLINSNVDQNYFVLEPNKEIFIKNVERINCSVDQFEWFDDIKNIPKNIEFAIIATSAEPRFGLMKSLIYNGVKKFLLEKIVFQSKEQFEVIISLLEENGCVAYCDFVNRYYKHYVDIKDGLVQNKPITMFVSGGDIRLGSNALHYVDLFEYLTGHQSKISHDNLKENKNVSEKGKIYRELLGQLVLSTSNGDLLIISANEDKPYSTEIIINQESQCHILNEQTKNYISFEKNTGLDVKDSNVLFSSQLTNTIYNEIINGTTLLPSVKQTKNCHLELFRVANRVFELDEDELCPMT